MANHNVQGGLTIGGAATVGILMIASATLGWQVGLRMADVELSRLRVEKAEWAQDSATWQQDRTEWRNERTGYEREIEDLKASLAEARTQLAMLEGVGPLTTAGGKELQTAKVSAGRSARLFGGDVIIGVVEIDRDYTGGDYVHRVTVNVGSEGMPNTVRMDKVEVGHVLEFVTDRTNLVRVVESRSDSATFRVERAVADPEAAAAESASPADR